MATCKIKDCGKILSKKQGKICPMHRMRFFRYRDYNYVSPKWKNLKKGKACLTKQGYLRVNIDGKRILQHRYLIEQSIGRKLEKNEIVRHKNKIRADNRIENLLLVKLNRWDS